MDRPDEGKVTELLNRVRAGNREDEAKLLELLYDQLRRLARFHMGWERPGHTLQPTALVHEAYLQVFGRDHAEWNGRSHFMARMSQEFRRLLIDHARQAKAAKRGGGGARLSLDALGGNEPAADPDAGVDAIAVHELLEELQRLDPAAAQVVELKFFSGMTDEEASAASGISIATLRRHWTFARAWFLSRLRAKAETH